MEPVSRNREAPEDTRVDDLPTIEVELVFGGGTHEYKEKGSGDRGTRTVRLYDGRDDPQRFRLHEHGFELVPSPGLVPTAPGTGLDLYDPEVFVRELFPKAAAIALGACPGATRAVVFDHIIRSPARARAEGRLAPGQGGGTPFLQGSLAVAHGDYTARSGYTRAAQLLAPFVDAAAVEQALAQRFALVNVWVPFVKVESDPLAMCTWQSMRPEDVVTNRLFFEHRVGETYKVKHSDRQQWCWFSNVTPDECLLFKVFDSSEDGESRFCVHSAFELPEQRRRAECGEPPLPNRESAEIRLLVFFGEGLENFAHDFVPPHMNPDLAAHMQSELATGVIRQEEIDFGAQGQW